MKREFKISTTSLILIIYTLSLWMPTYLNNSLIKLMLNVILLVTMVFLFKKKYRPSRLVVLAVLYFGYLCLISFVNHNNTVDIHTILSYAKTITFLALLEFCINRREKQTFKILLTIISILLLANFITVVLYPSGLYTVETVWNEWSTSERAQWLLGNKNSHGMWAVLGILISFCYINANGRFYSKITNLKTKIMVYCEIIILVAGLFLVKSSTGLIATVLSSIAFFMYLQKADKIEINTKLCIIVYGIVTCMILFGAVSFLQPILYTLFGKDVTFTGRVTIWQNALLNISRKPILGWGILDTGLVTDMLGSRSSTSAHNQYLNSLLQGGVVLFFVLLSILWNVSKNIDRLEERNIKNFLFLSLLSAMIIMIFESCLGEYTSWIVLLIINTVAQKCLREERRGEC